jgi:hypothetical protein
LVLVLVLVVVFVLVLVLVALVLVREVLLAEVLELLVRELLLADVPELLLVAEPRELLVPDVLELLVPEVRELDEPLDDVPPRSESAGSVFAVANASAAVRKTPITSAESAATTFRMVLRFASLSFISAPSPQPPRLHDTIRSRRFS